MCLFACLFACLLVCLSVEFFFSFMGTVGDAGLILLHAYNRHVRSRFFADDARGRVVCTVPVTWHTM